MSDQNDDLTVGMPPAERGDEINILDLLIVLAKHKKLIAGITLGAAIITALISFIMHPIYQAEVKILPPQQQSSSIASQLVGQLGGLVGMAGGGLSKTVNDLYLGVLKSRPVLDRVIDRFKLMDLYQVRYREDARRELLSALKAQDDKKSGIITIGVEDRDPKRAADIANAFVEELKGFNEGTAITEASQRRLFFEEQLKNAKDALIKTEEALKVFQEKTGVVEIKAQTGALIESVSRLRAQIAAKEVQIRVMRTYATTQNPDIQKVEEELKGLREQLGRLESNNAGRGSVTPAGNMPSVGTEYLRKVRDFKFSETLYELLLKQYEAAKIDEARDAAVIQVIETATPPEKKSKPRRGLMVTVAAVTAFFLAIFAAFIAEYWQKGADDQKNRERFAELRKHVVFRN